MPWPGKRKQSFERRLAIRKDSNCFRQSRMAFNETHRILNTFRDRKYLGLEDSRSGTNVLTESLLLVGVPEVDPKSGGAVLLLGPVREDQEPVRRDWGPAVLPLRDDVEEPLIEQPLAVVGLVLVEVHLLEEQAGGPKMPRGVVVGVQRGDDLFPKSEIRPSNLELNKEVERRHIHDDIETVTRGTVAKMARKFQAKILYFIKCKTVLRYF